MDGVIFVKLVSELADRLCGRRVEKVRRVADNVVALKINRDWLILSCEPQRPYLSLGRKPEAEEVVSDRFGLLLQKHLQSARLRTIESPGYDRVAFLRFTVWLEESTHTEPIERTLAAVLIGRLANLYLLDERGCIIERLADRGNASNRAGELFHAPPSRGKKDPRSLSQQEFVALVAEGESLAEVLAREIDGFGSLFAAEVEARLREIQNGETPDPVLAYRAFHSVVDDLFNKPTAGLIYSPFPLEAMRPGDLQPSDLKLSPIPLRQCAGMIETRYDSLVEAAAVYYRLVAEIEQFHRQKARALAEIKEQIEKKQKLIHRLEADLQALGDEQQWKMWGDLLLANAATAVRTNHGFRVVNYYDPDGVEIEIPADVGQTPQQAATAYFARYRKAKRGRQMISDQQARALAEIEQLEQRRQAVSSARTVDDLLNVVGRADGRPSLTRRDRSEKRTRRIPGVRRFLSSDGYEILVGKSAEDNERMTFKIAGPHDLWLHAADYAGSHVIVRKRKGETVPPQTLLEAAQLAAYFSQARDSGKVVVHYTERKFVSKIPRATPGLVRLADHKSLVVEPKIENVRRMDE
ncbi:MAG TPA: NFACT family protein [Blastocatellia bacterium]|nr:NFACT family protein [Blastocatellia bacterium]